nr:SdiA-regulated domain-containing protein [Streptomyces sp. NBC_00830]WTB35646.1 SdiA-regulated domain-containing protein [Streptomyces sp. NBC_00830]
MAATTCIPAHIWEELLLDVAAAVAFMRTCRSLLEEPDPEVYGRHKGVNGTEHAKELFVAALASGYVDEKGCEACPTGHLYTLSDA